jgi:hypothetical protein
MSFAQGFAGAFAQSFSQARDEKLKRELFLGEQNEKRKNALGNILPKRLSAEQEEQRVNMQLDYLENVRGVDPQTASVLYSDPDAREAAYSLLTTTGADWDQETTNMYVRSNVPPGTDTRPWAEVAAERAEILESLRDSEDPDFLQSSLTQLDTMVPSMGVTEFVPIVKPEKEEEGLNPRLTNLWGEQENLYKMEVLRVALEELDSVRDTVPEMTKEEREEFYRLDNEVENFDSNASYRLNIFNEFGARALNSIRQTSDPRVTEGLETNPRLPRFTTEGVMTFVPSDNPDLVTETQAPHMDVPFEMPTDAWENDDNYYIPLPEGGYRVIPKTRRGGI